VSWGAVGVRADAWLARLDAAWVRPSGRPVSALRRCTRAQAHVLELEVYVQTGGTARSSPARLIPNR
jgi:hypothetical protein